MEWEPLVKVGSLSEFWVLPSFATFFSGGPYGLPSLWVGL